MRHLLPFGGLFAAFYRAKYDLDPTLRFPICLTCRKAKRKLIIQSYDLEDREMRIVVHAQFREAVEQQRNARPN